MMRGNPEITVINYLDMGQAFGQPTSFDNMIDARPTPEEAHCSVWVVDPTQPCLNPWEVLLLPTP